ncbi:MAG: SUMF1/EgtB/PvdO family nonheme iron enzyme [Planctomycetaceae bacterium]|jgi:gamma-glutamyl hercynylcysteine S-oxide synthase|nr:SUMF1/EgtB/PvdO family nonheme iron enzyme [Planctomycetaceae bacterium]MBT6154042.1 SUMF1/EgtB/PvdO family nonheme iron enzyme [Planctomycetaceae bacterium]MBT6485098.1 SUMF1/EgtB/PvdO family nonheme iron enzyme [Planctomycetaceae bacterium]MBT6495911.1 SUMF1/EgtB/PvdO family nonheme iron enzyme [Planctomycetaceae bacterium]
MGVTSLFRRKSRDDRAMPSNRTAANFGSAENGPLIDSLLKNRRHCTILTATEEGVFIDQALALSWLALEDEMSLVPGCELSATDEAAAATESSREITAYYLDRFAVSNADYARFVNDGGYGQVELWPQEIWPNVLQFVDSTGHTGPRFWVDGKPVKHQDDHPVVGISWYEANAYARWAGKRLPVAAEWQHASSWCTAKDGRAGNGRYPWGDSFDPSRCNTWFRGPGETVPVDSHYEGCTPNGVYQLVGNVWEWVATQYSCGTAQEDVQIHFEQPMAEIRGGAFDTYFERQATCQFRTGQPFLYRGLNVGFRCCVSVSALAPPPDPSAFL